MSKKEKKISITSIDQISEDVLEKIAEYVYRKIMNRLARLA